MGDRWLRVQERGGLCWLRLFGELPPNRCRPRAWAAQSSPVQLAAPLQVLLAGTGGGLFKHHHHLSLLLQRLTHLLGLRMHRPKNRGNRVVEITKTKRCSEVSKDPPRVLTTLDPKLSLCLDTQRRHARNRCHANVATHQQVDCLL